MMQSLMNSKKIFKAFSFLPKPQVCTIIKSKPKINIATNDMFLKRNYPSVVRKEFETPISLEKLKNLDYKPKSHFKPQCLPDRFAFALVKFLRFFADTYFRNDYKRRVILLETVAAIPGLVGGMYRHLYSLRHLKDNGEIIEKLLKEAENERQHLLTFLDLGKPNLLDRLLIHTVQPVFFNFYLFLYGFFPRTSHRFVGYLEEEAVRSYDAFEEHILNGTIQNVPAPERAIKYWKLPENAKLVDVVRAIRADEAAHRDANHGFANEKPFKLA